MPAHPSVSGFHCWGCGSVGGQADGPPTPTRRQTSNHTYLGPAVAPSLAGRKSHVYTHVDAHVCTQVYSQAQPESAELEGERARLHRLQGSLDAGRAAFVAGELAL